MKRCILVILIFSFFQNCSNKEPFEVHPSVNRFPYTDNKVEIKIIERKFSDSVPEEVIGANKFLHRAPIKQALNIEIVDSLDAPLDDLLYARMYSNGERLFLNDFMNGTLNSYEKDLETWLPIAERGRGPGEVMFVNDLFFNEDELIVSQGNGRVSLFVCNNECTFKEELFFEDVVPKSVIKTNDSFLVMGTLVKFNSYNKEIKESLNSIHRVNFKGELEDSFGGFYNVQNQWMLINEFANGKIKTFSVPHKKIIQYFEKIPYLYVLEGKSLIKKIVFSGFNTSKQKYIVEEQELFINMEDWSVIHDLVFIDKAHILVTIQHYNNRKESNAGINWDESKDFYLIDTQSYESKYLGNFPINSYNNLWFTDEYIALLESEEIKIYKYELNNGH